MRVTQGRDLRGQLSPCWIESMNWFCSNGCNSFCPREPVTNDLSFASEKWDIFCASSFSNSSVGEVYCSAILWFLHLNLSWVSPIYQSLIEFHPLHISGAWAIVFPCILLAELTMSFATFFFSSLSSASDMRNAKNSCLQLTRIVSDHK